MEKLYTKTGKLFIMLLFTLIMMLIGMAYSNASEPVKNSVHIVSKGDTMYSLANAYNVDLKEFVKINRLTYESVIHVGDMLLIPESTVENDYFSTVNSQLKVYTIEDQEGKQFIYDLYTNYLLAIALPCDRVEYNKYTKEVNIFRIIDHKEKRIISLNR